ncbi:MAG: hypothetical protein AAGC74_07720 [Verrucomicrobiota bacterium]
MKRLLCLLLTLAPLLPADPATTTTTTTDFIRVDQDDSAARLQTSITTYTKDQINVTLLGAVHIGDLAYYQTLNEEFTKHDVLLFELIGGEDAAKHLNGQPRPANEKDGRPAENLRDFYGAFARAMKLSQQIDYIDYTPENFVHADLTQNEYDKITAEKGDDILAFALETSMKNSEITQQPFGGLDVGLVMRAMLSGDGSILKLELMKNMETGDEATAAITGENVVIDVRNEKCLKVMDEQIKLGKTNLGIFYGAAHFPDMEERLLKRGFKRTSHRWLTAWNVPKKPKKTSPPENS